MGGGARDWGDEARRQGFRDQLLALVTVVLAFEALLGVAWLALPAAFGRGGEAVGTTLGVSAAAVLSLGLGWALLRRLALRTFHAQLAADAAVMLVSAVPTAVLFSLEDPTEAGAGSTVSALGLFFVLRGALVATAGRQTALTAGAAAVASAAAWTAITTARGTADGAALLRLVVGLALFVGLATLCSKVVHGLRREVEQARRFGQYVIEEELGRGGMGVVYKAHHVLMARPTAVKVLEPRAMDAEGVARFRREVEVMAQLRHPNTVAVYDFGRSADGGFYYAMELVDGLNLHDLVARHGPMPAGRAVRVLDQVLGSLAEAHAYGLVHRDVKPGNVLLSCAGGEPDVAKVLDFGLAKDMAAAAHLTMAGQVLGTPLYMAPEAMRDASAAGPPSDLYGVAATGYFLVSGTHPFQAKNKRDLLRAVLEDVPEPPSTRRGARTGDALDAVLLRGLAKDPADRFRDAEAFRRALRQCDVAPWTREDGLEWWSERAPGPTPRPPAPSEGLTTRPRALRLDLSTRVGGADPSGDAPATRRDGSETRAS